MAIAAPTLPSQQPSLLHRWHLLSLDAPSVAVLWTIAAAHAAHASLSWTVPAAMFLAVWLLYVADRLMDFRTGHELEARHRFHGRYGFRFVIAAMAVTAVLGSLIALMPRPLLAVYAEICIPLALYFACIHFTGFRKRLPKEFVVGAFFAAAVYAPEGGEPHALASASFFGMLCWLNCVAIHRWENPDKPIWPARHFRVLAAGLAIISAAVPWTLSVHPFAILNLCVAVSALLLLAMDSVGRGASLVTLRSAADFALLTPLVLLFT